MIYTLVDTYGKVIELVKAIYETSSFIYADIESTGLDWFEDEILLLQLMFDNQKYIINVRELGYPCLYDIIDAINTTTHDKNTRVVFHNAKFDLKFLFHRSDAMLTRVYDTMISEVILNAGHGKPLYSLEELAEKYTGTFMDKDVRQSFINFPKDSPFTEAMFRYAAVDIQVLEGIHKAQLKEFEKTHQMRVMELDNDLIPVVAEMEYTGIGIVQDEWKKLHYAAEIRLKELYAEVRPLIADIAIKKSKAKNCLELVDKIKIKVTGKARRNALESIKDISLMRSWIIENFNFRSSYQKTAIMQLDGVKTTCADAKVIAKFRDAFPIVDKILRIAEVEKQISQYGINFLKDVHPYDNKIHTEYFTVGTRTGRFSSSKPNLQNVPTDGGYRECFVPTEGYVFIACDYSQQEYRLCGAVSREPVIINAYKTGKDMHTATAANFYHKSMDEITKSERSWGKTRNFEIIYGTTEWGLHDSLKCSLDEAVDVLNQYWKGYPVLSHFKEKVEDRITTLGFSATPIGRRRYNAPKPQFMDSRQYSKWQALIKREGFNHIIQGGGADIIKMAMVNIYHRNPFGNKFRILLQIHDELLVEVHKSIINEARAFLEDEMRMAEQPFLGEIPAVVESGIKERWSK